MTTISSVPSVGANIRAWRRRRGGMSQKTLAGLAGISQPYLSMIENGERALDRRQQQVAIAEALQISVAELLGDLSQPADPLKDRALGHVPQIRAKLVEVGAGEIGAPARDVDEVRAAVELLTQARNAADYAALAPLLPGLVCELAAHGAALAPEMVSVLFAARYALKTLGFPDLAREAAEIGRRAAAQYDDPAWQGQATYSWVQSLPPEAADLGRRVAARAADDLQGAPGRQAKEIYGCLHILSGFEAAVAGDAGQAWSHLGEADAVAGVLGEPERTSRLNAGINGNWFGPTQVAVWRMAVAAELGDTGAAQRVSQETDLSLLPVPNRHVYYHTDRARAFAAGGRDREAMVALTAAERSAPQHFRLNPVARNLVETLVERARRRAVTPEFAHLARSVGVPA